MRRARWSSTVHARGDIRSANIRRIALFDVSFHRHFLTPTMTGSAGETAPRITIGLARSNRK